MEISAACIPRSFDEWKAFVARVDGAADAMHLDVCDGAFVPTTSWPLVGDRGEWAKLVGQHDGLPGWEGHDFEVDLMVENPAARFRDFIEAGFSRIIVHWESLGADRAAELELMASDDRADIWLAASPDTDPADYMGELGFVAGFQCMGIAKIGYQGQPFDPRTPAIVQLVRAANPDLPISVDGGMNVETVGQVAHAGAARVVVGSALVKAENPEAAAAEIREAADLG